MPSALATRRLLAAWRAGLLPWWPVLVIALGSVSAQAVPGGFGLPILALTLLALAYALWRMLTEPVS
jgi:hypothetical protein